MYNIKCLVIGDSCVGKSSLLVNYTTNTFSKDYIHTTFDNYLANVIIDGKLISLALWDTDGLGEYVELRTLSYQQTDVFILCFSITSFTSYVNIKSKWLSELKFHSPN